MNATFETTRSRESSGLDFHLISMVCGVTLALSGGLLSGAWKGEPSTPQAAQRAPIPPAYARILPQKMPSATIYVLRDDIEATMLTTSINDYGLTGDMYGAPLMEYSVLVARTPEEDVAVDLQVAERSREYTENGMMLHIVDLRKPRP
jgi:hypothetical protein